MRLDAAGIDVLASEGDGTLAARAAEDFEAFAELYRRYIGPVYRFVRSQISDDATAEDVTAQVFFKALASAHTFRGEGAYQAWLFRIAHNQLSTYRKRKRGALVVLDDIPETEDPAPTPVTQAITTEGRDLVRKKVGELPAAQREVVVLRYLNDFSIEEVAKITRRTRGAVRILLHRARGSLRQTLDGKELT